jgi:nicotinamidase-related amidase
MTSHPTSLLRLAGASLHPSPLETSALIIIDAQGEYVTGRLPLRGMGAAVAETKRLLELARSRGTPVFHVVHHARSGAAVFDPEGPYVAIVPELAPMDRETIVTKSLPNAFAKTDLHDLVVATGRKELIVAGFMTHMCVSSTARAALDLGYRTTIVASATATRDLPKAVGNGVIPAEVVQESALAALADRFAVVVPDTAALVG